MDNRQTGNRLPKIIVIPAVLFGLLILGTIVYLIIPKAYIKMSVAPDEVSVTVDGGKAKQVKTGSTMLVGTGKHTYVISRQDFDPLTITLEAGNNETKELLAALNPKTDAAAALLETNKSQEVVQKYYAHDQVQTTDTLDKNYPIPKDLPIYARLYSIDSCPSVKYPNDDTKIALCVDMSQDGLQPYVEKDLRSRGYDPTQFEILYTGPSDEAQLNNNQ